MIRGAYFSFFCIFAEIIERHGKRQDSIRLRELRTGISEVDREVSGLRTMEHLQGDQDRK
jgi:hypothetical protein